MPRPAHRVLAVAAIGGLGILGACGDSGGGGGDSAAFCQQLTDNHQRLFVDLPASQEAAEDLVVLMRSISNDAPIAIEQEWAVLTEVFAQLVDSDEPGSQADLAAAYASERSAVALQAWARDNCGLEIAVGRVATPAGNALIVGTTTVPVGTATEAP